MELQLLHESFHKDAFMRLHCMAGLGREERNQRSDGAAGFILRRWLGEECPLGAGCGGSSIDKWSGCGLVRLLRGMVDRGLEAKG